MDIAKPASAAIGIKLLWANVVLGVAVEIGLLVFSQFFAFNLPDDPKLRETAKGLIFIVPAVIIFFNAFIAYKTGRGRNWARIVFIVCFALGLLGLIGIGSDWRVSKLNASFEVLATLLQLGAVICLTRPAAGDWFKDSAIQDFGG